MLGVPPALPVVRQSLLVPYQQKRRLRASLLLFSGISFLLELSLPGNGGALQKGGLAGATPMKNGAAEAAPF